MRLPLLATVLIGLAACGGGAADPLDVTTENGALHGVMDGDGVRAFRGIPFAAPPVGANRFRPPQPAADWQGTRDAANVGNMCPQSFNLQPGGGDEDCLYLNVFTPSPAAKEPLPVMVWFHGGAFIFGSGGETYYDGAKLAAHGVVVVTVNYRLGPLGWLALDALDAEDPSRPSGNLGFLDQIAALQWVKRNVAAFGGDPTKVTIFGESAGGFSACVHYLSSMSRGLYDAVISESGLCSGDLVEITHAQALASGATFAQSIGCSGADVLACLRAKPFTDYVDATATPPVSSQLPGGLFYQGSTAPTWGPNVDGVVLATSTRAGFAAGGFPPVPLLLGSNKNEGTLFAWGVIAKEATDETDVRAALARRFGMTNVDAILAHYPVASYASPNLELADVAGDAFFVCAARRTARAAAAAGAPVHLYAFQRELAGLTVNDGGVIHSGEIPFVFGVDSFPLGNIGAGAPLVDDMQGYWTRFAATGDPNGAGALTWPAYDAAGDANLVLDVPLSTEAAHKQALCDFWDSVPLP